MSTNTKSKIYEESLNTSTTAYTEDVEFPWFSGSKEAEESSCEKTIPRGKLGTLWKLKHLLIFVCFGILQNCMGPSIPYIQNSFFAQNHGGGDCFEDPECSACRMGAADAALYEGWSGTIANVIAIFFALANGTHSDSIGRLPLVKASSSLRLLPVLALAVHMFAGTTLWFYLVLQPLADGFDVNGVFLAIMSDIIVDPQERAAAYGLFLTSVMILSGAVAPLSFFLPRETAMVVTLCAGAAKVLYLFVVFPETRPRPSSSPTRGKSSPSPSFFAAVGPAYRVLTRNSFIIRVATVLVLSGLAASGYNIVMSPWLTGYLGFKREDTFVLFVGATSSVLIWFAAPLGWLVRAFGDIRVMCFSQFVATLFPVACSLCSTQLGFVLVASALAGPLMLIVPVVTAIKSNLVEDSEQGCIQGFVASVGKATMIVGYLAFSYLFRVTSNAGQLAGSAAVQTPFYAIAGINSIALLVCCSLPPRTPGHHAVEEADASKVVQQSDGGYHQPFLA
eukprot:TRINITY_DN20918_c0_g1_i1.p1 TRINITY_DN20918_c0_g1~~TRINITY_DN20918_c0_g1_i1.p1  ORF type:complete len:506 (-),score=72.09 TRINITY_DN20918_c0_g1_i1:443-1960(-)